VFRKSLSRAQLLPFLAQHPGCLVAMEACATSQHWGQTLADLGHPVRLIARHRETLREAPEERHGRC
jgi:transposase